jgi:hypothetical protein
MRWWYIHKIQNQCIGFFLKPIMKRWQVLHMHNFVILINRVSLRKDLGYDFKKYGKKMLMLDYHSVQCS